MGQAIRSIIIVAGICLATLSTAVRAAELKMNWQGHASDGVLVEELSVGQQATIEYRLVLVDGDRLSGLFFSNETVADLAQAATAASPANWQDGSTAGDSLGGGGQQVAFAAANPLNDALMGPGEFLIGTQTVELTGGAVGQEFEVTFSTAQLGVINDLGNFYGFTATGSAFENEVEFFHIGIGSPGYRRMQIDDVREPLIIRVAQGGGGGGGGPPGGGGGTGGNDNTNDNTNGNDNGGNDNANMNDNGAGGNDNVNTNDNGAGNDNGANDNTNDNGAGNDNANGGNDNSAGNGNANTNDNGGGIGNTGNDNGGGGGGNQGPGLCGLGLVSVLPLNLLGLFVIRTRRAARRRTVIG